MTARTYSLPDLLKGFFNRLRYDMNASPHTIDSYRYTWRLFLHYVTNKLKKNYTDIKIEDLDSDLVTEFLHHLEQERSNSVQTRNLRLAAIRGLFDYIASREPELLLACKKVLSIPSKRNQKRMVDYLEPTEIAALVAAPDLSTWIGRRDRCVLVVALQTGFRVSELIDLKLQDVYMITESVPFLRVYGKGRKERRVPLRADSLEVLAEWLQERGETSSDSLFISNRRCKFSRDGIWRLVKKYVKKATLSCPSIGEKRVSPHTLRHSCAMDLLRNDGDCTTIALWLGHESIETTQVYLHAEMEIKKRAMEQTRPVDVPKGVYQPNDDILAFLNSL